MTQRTSQPTSSDLPVVVIGAGPVGLACAAHLIARGLEPLVLEAGPSVGASVRQWEHVKMFSPWGYNVDRQARQLLENEGWMAPNLEELPTGRDLVERYLEPLAATSALAPRIRLDARVVAVGRSGLDKVKTPGRSSAPFRVHVERVGSIEVVHARAVIDVSGTWTSPNPVGAGGIPAPGEHAAGERIFYGIPDVQGRDRERYAGKRTLVVGTGHSAMNALLDLTALHRETAAGEVLWALRRDVSEMSWGGGDRDALAARGTLGARLREHFDAGEIETIAPFSIESISPLGDALTVRGIVGKDGAERDFETTVDEIVAATGSRPDLSFLREVRLDLDPALESARILAPLIDPNIHSCGTVRPHGEQELRQPEDGFYIAGMKSYGRAPTFLLATGYEQVRSIVATLAGDHDAAGRVELDLPETGVCSSKPCCVSSPQSTVPQSAEGGCS